MVDMTPTYTEPVLALMACSDEVVPAYMIAPILKMKPDVMIKYAKEGKWRTEICNYVVSGEGKGAHVKFFRIDFLKKGGWIS